MTLLEALKQAHAAHPVMGDCLNQVLAEVLEKNPELRWHYEQQATPAEVRYVRDHLVELYERSAREVEEEGVPENN